MTQNCHGEFLQNTIVGQAVMCKVDEPALKVDFCEALLHALLPRVHLAPLADLTEEKI